MENEFVYSLVNDFTVRSAGSFNRCKTFETSVWKQVSQGSENRSTVFEKYIFI